MEKTVPLIPMVVSGSGFKSSYVPSPPDERRPALFVAGRSTNLDHFKFGLRGCVAASLCYIIYTSVDWPGISTAITTCLLTALSHSRLIPPETVLAFRGRHRRRRGGGDGSASVHSALP